MINAKKLLPFKKEQNFVQQFKTPKIYKSILFIISCT